MKEVELSSEAAETATTTVPKLDEQKAKSNSVPMQPAATLAEAGRTALLKHLEKLRHSEDKARESDPEGVHDMRVATRRLRAGLKVMEETVWEAERVADFRRKLRSLANALGETRDSDVFMEHLESHAATLPEDKVAGLEPLKQSITNQREAGRTEMLATLDKKKTSRLLKKLEKFLSTPGKGVRPQPSDANEAVPMLVRHFSGSAIWKGYEEVLAYETKLPGDIMVWHRLRVACKRLRYTLEFFQDALPPTANKLIEQLTSAQDHLGALHDHQVAIERIQQLEKKHPDDQALKDYVAVRAASRDKLFNEVETLWSQLSGADFRQKLASLLADKKPK